MDEEEEEEEEEETEEAVPVAVEEVGFISGGVADFKASFISAKVGKFFIGCP